VTTLPEPAPIREFGRVDAAEFQNIRSLGKPAVFRGLASGWPAVQAAMRGNEHFIAYLKRFPEKSRPAAIVGPPELRGRFFYNDDVTALNFQRGVTDLEPFLDRLLRDREEPAPIAMAVQSEPVSQLLPGFETENRVEILHPPVPPRAWIGNRIQVATHYDLQENVGVVVAGRRRFTVFPPQQLPNLYPGPFELTPAGTPISMVDPYNPDLERYPRFAEAMKTALRAELGPGDAIYIPYHWWHGVDSLEPVNLFINYWWSDAPAEAGSPYDALMYAFFALKLLPPEQREVWRMVFDHYVFCANGDPGEHLPEHARGILGPPTPELLNRMRITLKKIAAGL
jgi:mannose-6-phosphate isomerase-like protein (cupin superfamily)